MEAKDLFRDLGFKKINQNDYCLVYLYENDYAKIYVQFDLSYETYSVNCERFIDRNDIAFVPMVDRPENLKHTCHYGHWQSETYIDIDMRLHNAIHQQIVELGWIKEK